MMVMTSIDMPYVEIDEEAVECSFWSLEFVNATFVGEGSKIQVPHLSKSSLLEVSEILERGCLASKGLGRNLKERTNVVQLAMKTN